MKELEFLKLYSLVMRRIKSVLGRLFSKDGGYWLLLYLIIRPLKYSKILSDQFIVSTMFRCELGRSLDLNTPKTFNEKLQWLKLNIRDPLFPTIVDKIKAKEYVGGIIGEEYIIPTYQIVSKFDEIDFEALPEMFVIKANHDSGSVYVCKNKIEFEKDRKRIQRRFDSSLKRNYYYEGREWAYKNVKPMLLVEKYLQNDNGAPLRDYKFFCFDGEPKFLYVSEELYSHNKVRMQYLSADFTATDIHFDEYESFTPEKPEKYEEMKMVCRELSRNLKFARIDLYYINGRVYFSEITLYPASGFRKYPYDVDLRIGKLLKI